MRKAAFLQPLPRGMVMIRADAPGYAPALARRTAPSRDIELALAPASKVSGTVIDAVSGEPVPGGGGQPVRVDEIRATAAGRYC